MIVKLNALRLNGVKTWPKNIRSCKISARADFGDVEISLFDLNLFNDSKVNPIIILFFVGI